MTNPDTQVVDEELKKVLSRVMWGDFQDDAGLWGRGVSNKPQLIELLKPIIGQQLVKELELAANEIIGEDEPYKATFNHDTPTPETAAGIAKQKLRAEQRQRAKERIDQLKAQYNLNPKESEE